MPPYDAEVSYQTPCFFDEFSVSQFYFVAMK